MNFTFHQLQVFLEVVRQESITRAAEEMYMTQPALSIQLKNFQAQFDIPLTEIIGKKLFVTDFGRSIAEVAENVLKEADALKFKTKEYRGVFTGRLRISSASTGKYVIPYFLSGFLQKYTGVDLVLDVTNKTRVISSLKNNEIDFALVSSLPNDIEINEAKLLENKLYLVSGPEENSNRQLLIFREEGSATRVAMDTYFSKVQTRKRLELTSNEAVKQAVMAGLGQSLLPLIGIRNELLNHQIRIIPSKDLPIVSSWRLIWLKKKKCSPVAEAYLNFVEKNREEIVAKSFKWYLDFDELHFT